MIGVGKYKQSAVILLANIVSKRLARVFSEIRNCKVSKYIAELKERLDTSDSESQLYESVEVEKVR